MGAVRSLTLLAAGAVLGAAALIAHRISEETGKPLQEALAEVPSELESLLGEIMSRGEGALEKGRTLYEEKRAEVSDHLKESTSAH